MVLFVMFFPLAVQLLSVQLLSIPRATDSFSYNPSSIRPKRLCCSVEANVVQAEKSWRQCVTAPSPKTGPLNEVVADLASTSLSSANSLIEIGAVWAQMDTLSEEDLLAQYYESPGISQYADMPKGHGESREPTRKGRYRRILTPCVVTEGTSLRIYPVPRRFPACEDLDKGKLLHEDTTFVVVDKPPMLPTQPDSSNYFECCPGCVNKNMGPFETIDGEKVDRPLLCHRVDSCVGGVVVLSKDGNGQKVFSQLQRDRKIKKLYRTITTKPVPLGMHVHYMWAATEKRGSQGPPCRLLSHKPPSERRYRDLWIRCILEVTSSDPISLEQSSVYTPPANTQHYQSTIRLVTGRKHQVRAQLSSLGCPIVNDSLYQPIAGMTLDELSQTETEENLDLALQQCVVPQKPIGLQAHAIMFGGIRVKAGTPWWGDGTDKLDQ